MELALIPKAKSAPPIRAISTCSLAFLRSSPPPQAIRKHVPLTALSNTSCHKPCKQTETSKACYSEILEGVPSAPSPISNSRTSAVSPAYLSREALAVVDLRVDTRQGTHQSTEYWGLSLLGTQVPSRGLGGRCIARHLLRVFSSFMNECWQQPCELGPSWRPGL